jgi:hypothetical protein
VNAVAPGYAAELAAVAVRRSSTPCSRLSDAGPSNGIHRQLRAACRRPDAQQIERPSRAAPPIDDTEIEVGDYAVRPPVKPFDLVPFALAVQEQNTGKRKPVKGAEAGATPPFELLTVPAGARSSPLLEIVVRVHWLEGSFEREVTRTTFASDPVLVQQAVAALPGAGGEPAPGRRSRTRPRPTPRTAELPGADAPGEERPE